MVIRPIRAEDKRMLSDGLRRLSPESVQRRFLTPKRSFSRAELRYLTEVDGRDHVALVAEDPADPVRRLIAVGRFVRLHDDPETADVAFTVADEWQGRGLGSLLGIHLSHLARNRGIRRFTATMASDNRAAGISPFSMAAFSGAPNQTWASSCSPDCWSRPLAM